MGEVLKMPWGAGHVVHVFPGASAQGGTETRACPGWAFFKATGTAAASSWPASPHMATEGGHGAPHRKAVSYAFT